jgi:hypothetical protein
MLNATLKGGLAAVAAVAALCAPFHATAALAPVDVSGAAVAPDYLAQAMRHTLAIAAPSADLPDLELTGFAPPAMLLQSPGSFKLRASSDLALWQLVATVHAQQQNKVFDLVDAGTKTVWKLEQDQVSAVPVPGVLWLFVMGLLGIAGTRQKGQKGQGQVGRERVAGQPLGMTPAAA